MNLAEAIIDAVLPFRAMAYNNAWANHRLLVSCAKLAPAEFSKNRIGFFGSIKATLNNNLCVDRFYIDAMEGGKLGPAAWIDPEPHDAVASLLAEQKTLDDRLISIVTGLTASELDNIVRIDRGSRTQLEKLYRILLHLFQHQIHHRGQVHNMISDTTIAPPQLDEFFSEEEANLRESDFADLGWTEHDIWCGADDVRD